MRLPHKDARRDLDPLPPVLPPVLPRAADVIEVPEGSSTCYTDQKYCKILSTLVELLSCEILERIFCTVSCSL